MAPLQFSVEILDPVFRTLTVDLQKIVKKMFTQNNWSKYFKKMDSQSNTAGRNLQKYSQSKSFTGQPSKTFSKRQASIFLNLLY